MSCQVCHRLLCRCPAPDLTEYTLLDSRLAVALAKLKEIAAACVACGGTGEVRSLWQAFLFENDPRIPARGLGRAGIKRRERGRLEQLPRTAGWLVSRCPDCADLRQVIETAGGKS